MLQLLTEVKGWKQEEGERTVLTKTFEFADFKVAMQFMNRVADTAEKVRRSSRAGTVLGFARCERSHARPCPAGPR